MLLSVGVAAAAWAGRAVKAAASNNAVLHFADMNGGIRDWRPAHGNDSDAILIEGRNNEWYRATFWAPCPEIHFTPKIGFVTDALGDLDQFTSIIADGTRCYFRTFERTTKPEESRGQGEIKAEPK